MKKQFQAAIMERATKSLQWSNTKSYTGDWKGDIKRAADIIEMTERACLALDEAFPEETETPTNK